ncbi:hypothetical protein BC828DRAFT_406160 [Blastocladiella britannica]|nr:hypothetical protein BC828DRAFT_406160 [Blastocladiella britannica]
MGRRSSRQSSRSLEIRYPGPPLAAQLAAPRLSPFPKALQLPGLFLLTSELDRFKDPTRRLVTGPADLDHRQGARGAAVMAAAEGRVDLLDHLDTELAVDPQALTAFLSFQMPMSFFLQSLIQFSTLRRVVPTWKWLLADGYVYPVLDVGAPSMLASNAAEYATLRTFFLEYDKPRILAVTEIPERLSQFQSLVDSG